MDDTNPVVDPNMTPAPAAPAAEPMAPEAPVAPAEGETPVV
jgi:hypothetical protein